jgi:hypothetical protein
MSEGKKTCLAIANSKYIVDSGQLFWMVDVNQPGIKYAVPGTRWKMATYERKQ